MSSITSVLATWNPRHRRSQQGIGGSTRSVGGAAGMPRRATSRVGANAWCQQAISFDLALFEPIFIQIFQQKWTE
jgi:hypothetical protein